MRSDTLLVGFVFVGDTSPVIRADLVPREELIDEFPRGAPSWRG